MKTLFKSEIKAEFLGGPRDGEQFDTLSPNIFDPRGVYLASTERSKSGRFFYLWNPISEGGESE
jgi:hypothetical protein